MRVEYGPPGVRGVTTILGLGAEDAAAAAYADKLVETSRKGAAVLAAATVISWLVGARSLAKASVTGAAVLVAVMAIARR